MAILCCAFVSGDVSFTPMKKIKLRYRASMVIGILILSLMAIEGQNKPVEASNYQRSTMTQLSSKDSSNALYTPIIDRLFGSCSGVAMRYLGTVNPSYDPALITHNYIGDTKVYDSSYVGLFQVNDSDSDVVGYSISDLLDPAKNTEIAYQLFVKNGYRFADISCLTY